MRILGSALVIAALALGTGGVSLRPAVAGDSANVSVEQEAADRIAPPARNSCGVAAREPVQLSIPITPAKNVEYIPLNTRGYNYPAPDDAPERFVPDSTGRSRPANLPERQR